LRVLTVYVTIKLVIKYRLLLGDMCACKRAAFHEPYSTAQWVRVEPRTSW